MSTRNTVNKYIINECYKPSEEFPSGRLPTLKQVLERCLFFKEYRTENVQRQVSEEVHNLWIKYNVYPISANAIQMRLNKHTKIFSRLQNYDKKKQGPKFKLDASKFIEDSNKLFDIFQKDHKNLAAAEKEYLLKMTDDHKFYEDQRTVRRGYCTSKPVPLTSSEIKFRKRKIQKIERAKKSQKPDYLESKASCSYQLFPESDQESPISESTSQENIQQSDVEMLATSPNNEFDPDYVADGLSDQQNRSELRTLAEACDRNKLRRERNKLRKERQKEEEKVFDNITGIGFDGRRDATLQI